MDLISMAVNPQAEIEGARVEYEDEDGTVLIIARFNNRKFRAMQARLMEPLVRSAGRKGVSTEQANEILNKCVAGTILLGWENLKLEGQLIEYSPEKCKEVLSDPRLADFKELVVSESQDLEHYRIKSLEEDSGKLQPSSPIAAAGV